MNSEEDTIQNEGILIKKDSGLSESFKKHLYFPSVVNKKKVDLKQRAPSAVSSQKWRQFMQEKDNFKIELENEKAIRKENRLKRKAEKENLQQQRTEKKTARENVSVNAPKKRGRPKKC